MIREELRRLLSESNEQADRGLMQVEVSCDGDAHKVLERVTEALALILSVESISEDNDEHLVEPSYALLERWFEENLLSDLQNKDVSQDSSRVRHFSDERDWFWWAARTMDENTLFVYIMLEGFPVSGFDDLLWLLQCCGGVDVEQGPAVKVCDIPEQKF